MKTLICKTILAATLVLTLAASSFTVNATTGDPYDNRLYYPVYIAIRNTTKDSFAIKDVKGNTILSGKIGNKKSFTIRTEKLGAGTYQLYLGDDLAKKFDVQ